MKHGAKLTLTGIALGVFAALTLTRVMSTLLYGVDATDPFTFIAVAILLAIVASLAYYIPAGRASKIDPILALRYE
jgi:putative ABC transport system permease protein